MKKHNFYAGPAILPEAVIKATSEAVLELSGSGLSLMEISHRSKEFMLVMDEAVALFKEVLGIPDGYSVLFLGGGANTQFAMIPMNLLHKKAAYLDTGSWANKAIKEAQKFGDVIVAASSKDNNYNNIPKGYAVPADSDYFHITTNNTIYGTEIKEDLDVGVRLVADMSSDIFSRPVDVSKYDLIYGGAQKNLGPAGVTFVVIKDDVAGKSQRVLPTMMDYTTHISKNSMYNTPPALPVFACLETLKWIKAAGGVEEMHRMNREKAEILYGEIERNVLFNPVVPDPEDRSIMNVCFVMTDEYKELEADFIQAAAGKDIVGIKGHRSVGGFRASIYNAMPLSSVKVLIETMREFEKAKA